MSRRHQQKGREYCVHNSPPLSTRFLFAYISAHQPIPLHWFLSSQLPKENARQGLLIIRFFRRPHEVSLQLQLICHELDIILATHRVITLELSERKVCTSGVQTEI
eukprot:g73360.t1